MGYFLEVIDYNKHNEEVKEVWDTFHSGKPIRVPVILGTNPRIFLLNPELNGEKITFRQYFEDPDIMALVQMKTAHYIRHNMLQDAEMGLPKDGWPIYVDLQNVYEAAWFGAAVEYREGQVPDTRPFLTEDNKRMLFDRGLPDPFKAGIMEKNWRFYEHFKANLSKYSYMGLPAIEANPAGMSTDGPMTIAANLRGATEFCMDLYTDPDYVRELLAFITEAIILRIKAYRKALGQEMKPRSFGFADDSIELLSTEMYKEFVMPFHKKLIEELGGEGPHSVHLCGDVGRHMTLLKDELNINGWDAGFPVDYSKARAELGPNFLIQTGPKVATLVNGTPSDVEAETRCILESGIANGRFILREANNLSPLTPVENIAAMYEAARKFGKY